MRLSGVDSIDKVKHSNRNSQLLVRKRMQVAEQESPQMMSECCEVAEQR